MDLGCHDFSYNIIRISRAVFVNKLNIKWQSLVVMGLSVKMCEFMSTSDMPVLLLALRLSCHKCVYGVHLTLNSAR